MKKQKEKQTIKKIIFKVIMIILSLATVYYFAAPKFFNPDTAFAVGDLTIDWGVPTGDPIFVVTNMLPGDSEQREVDVTNDGIVSHTVAIRGEKTSETLNFSTVLDFVILDGATPIYGTGSLTGSKTLAQFFTDSGGFNGLELSTLDPSESATYTFKATFDINAGNEFQNALVIFDLIIGIVVDEGDIPDECDHITFSGTPIFGTSAAETITGTPGNDLIFGLEGADIINGNNGDDCIVGGPGAENQIHGNNGNDVIFGNEGADHIKGNNGDDLIFGGADADVIDGGNGNDHLVGNEGPDELNGENGDDLLEGNEGADSLRGGNGVDILRGGDGADGLRGDAGNDNLDGGAGMDSANGNAGVDTCTAESETNCEI